MCKRVIMLVVVLGLTTALIAAGAETISRVFRLEHVSVLEVSAAVQPLLSDDGSLTVQPKHSRIVVQDQPEVIDRVTALIEEIDHVPGSYSVRIDLLEGGEPKPYGSVDEIEAEERLRKMFNVGALHRLASSTIEGVLGSPAQADLGDSFHISFLAQILKSADSAPWGTPDPGQRIHLRQLVLERKAVSADGTMTTDQLLRTNVLLSPKQTVYIGAGNSEESKQVLVMIVHAEDFRSR